MLPVMSHAVVAEVVRSGFVESVHMGSAVALSSNGEMVVDIGTTREPIFARSSNKPLQAAAMVRAGLWDLADQDLALIAASHSGEAFHIEGVDEILSASGMDRSFLRCPPDLPLDPDAARELLRSGGRAEPAYMNCSGKHAGMLAACVAARWPTDGYTEPDHPLQKEIRETIERLSGEPVSAIGIDGCGAPLFAVTLAGLAWSYRALVLADPGTPERRVAEAIRAHPERVSGTRRDERALMAGVPGLVIKGGAEGVAAFALRDGRAGAVKIGDGSARARTPVVVSVLRKLGVEAPVLAEHATTAVLGGGRRVGEVRSVI